MTKAHEVQEQALRDYIAREVPLLPANQQETFWRIFRYAPGAREGFVPSNMLASAVDLIERSKVALRAEEAGNAEG